MTVAMQSTASVSDEFNVAMFSIPIGVSIVDAFLNPLGIRLAALQIPINVQLGGSSQFGASATATVNFAGNVGASYANGIFTPADSLQGSV